MARISSLHAIAECRPPRPAWWHYPLMALYAAMPGVFVFIAVFITMELLNGFTTSADVKLWLLAGGYVAGLALMVLFLYWEQQRWYWVLTVDALVGGIRHDRVFPISSMVRIVPGRPVTKLVKYAFGRGVTQHTRDTLKVAYGMSLVIEFSDGSLMPFHVHACDGGTHLMNQLIETHRALFDKNYELSERQKKALVIADWNKRTKPLRRL